jgi:hypothetical protein
MEDRDPGRLLGDDQAFLGGGGASLDKLLCVISVAASLDCG